MIALFAAAWAQDLVVDGVDVVLSGRVSYREVVLTNGGRILVHPLADGGGSLRIDALHVRIERGSAIVAVGAGHPGVPGGDGAGPGGGGAGAVAGGGGGGGGAGGAGFGEACFADGRAGAASSGAGSAGGGVPNVAGGAGGGEIEIRAATIDIRGSIDASGEDGLDGAGGGGGGSITLEGDRVLCSGRVVARGGAGGGGGSVRVEYDVEGPACVPDVSPGAGECGCGGGEGVVTRVVADWDGDGVTAPAGDCASDDAAVVPGAPDDDCDGADDDCDGSFDEDAASCADCARIDQGPGSAWLICDQAEDHDGALATCEGLGGWTLVTVGDQAEQDLLELETSVRADEWLIGFDDRAVEGQFAWRSGLPITFADWALAGSEPQPNDEDFGSSVSDCVVFDAGTGGWRDVDCAIAYPFVCETCPVRPVWVDVDGDGWGDLGGPSQAGCGPAPGYADRPGDCDDADPDAHPAALERCDGVDQDCDGVIDEAPVGRWPDGDGDGAGDPSKLELAACDDLPADTVDRGGDCDDGDAQVGPAQPELCDGVDQDCDGQIDEDDVCACPRVTGPSGQGILLCDDRLSWDDAATACADLGYELLAVGDGAEFEVAAALARQSSTDDVWIGLTDEADEDLWVWANGEVVTFAQWQPGSPAGSGYGTDLDCAVLDNDQAYWWDDRNCVNTNALACEAACAQHEQRRDGDGDGFGAGPKVLACPGEPGFAGNALDCDDADVRSHPGAVDVEGDGVDQDCDGVDPCVIDADADGFGVRGAGPCAAVPLGDCDDADPAVHPGAIELPADGVDQDCDCAQACFADRDGDGLGGEVVQVGGDCGEGTAPVSGDCDDADPEVGACAPPPTGEPDPLLSEEGLSSYLPCGCAAGPRSGWVVAVLLLLLRCRTRPAR